MSSDHVRLSTDHHQLLPSILWTCLTSPLSHLSNRCSCSLHLYTMPASSHREEALRFLGPIILALFPHRHRKTTRRHLRVLAALHRHISINSYWDRYPTVNANIPHPSFSHHHIEAVVERGFPPLLSLPNVTPSTSSHCRLLRA